jgi:hypothetical protein
LYENIVTLPASYNYKLKKSVYDKERDERSFTSLYPVGLQWKK